MTPSLNKVDWFILFIKTYILIHQMLISKRGQEGDPFNLSNYCQDANLVIAPKRGTAIMWYNHFLDPDSEWLGDRDPYTLHGGCDVRRGKKWIANHWIPAPYKNYQHIPSIYRRRIKREQWLNQQQDFLQISWYNELQISRVSGTRTCNRPLKIVEMIIQIIQTNFTEKKCLPISNEN